MMGMRIALIAAAVMTVTGIKVPIEKTDDNVSPTKDVDGEESPEVDSYFVPSEEPDQPAEDISDEIATLATYLLPPTEDKESEYYSPTEAGEQTDWYPIAPAVAPLPRALLPPRQTEINPIVAVDNLSEPVFGSFRTGKVIDKERIPSFLSRDLQPPLENAPNEYAAFMNDEVVNFPFENQRAPRPAGYPSRVWNGPAISVSNNLRSNSKAQAPYPRKYKNPTKLYPKKYVGVFKPVPIPITQFIDESLVETPVAQTHRQIKPNQNIENEYEIPYEDKNSYKYDKSQKKKKLKGEHEIFKIEEPESSETTEDDSSPEQDASASNYRVPLRNLYAAPLKSAPPAPLKRAPAPAPLSHSPPADGERTEFRMHGMKGPHSYQFGFDTGKGKNRQFRYEERDNEGRVKGHYGYMDKHGKLRVVNYDADPEHGFRADAPVGSE